MNNTIKTYAEKLKDPRWQKKRLEIFQIADWKCEDCGDVGKEIQVHHSYYIPGKDPWEYDSSLLMCVCPECHVKRQGVEVACLVGLAKIMRRLRFSELWEVTFNILEYAYKKYVNKGDENAAAFGGDQ